MTVQELIDELLNHDPDAKVILQKDAEGNGYSPLVGAEECVYLAETTWSGQTLAPGDDEAGIAAVVLWPVN